MLVKIDLDQETAGRLAQAAVTERRPVNFQAEILLRRQLGLPDPRWTPEKESRSATTPTGEKEMVGCIDQPQLALV